MCKPATHKDTITRRAASVKMNRSSAVGFGNRAQHSNTAAKASIKTEIISGARTGPAHIAGIRNNISQSITDAGQPRRIFNQT